MPHRIGSIPLSSFRDLLLPKCTFLTPGMQRDIPLFRLPSFSHFLAKSVGGLLGRGFWFGGGGRGLSAVDDGGLFPCVLPDFVGQCRYFRQRLQSDVSGGQRNARRRGKSIDFLRLFRFLLFFRFRVFFGFLRFLAFVAQHTHLPVIPILAYPHFTPRKMAMSINCERFIIDSTKNS